MKGTRPGLTGGRGYELRLASRSTAVRAAGGRAKEDLPPEVPTIFLYDEFVDPSLGFLGGVTANQVLEDLEVLADEPEIHVRVNSPGGDVWAGIAIYNALSRFPGRVTLFIDGMAASIASLVALAGEKTVIADNAMVMVHRPWTIVAGDAVELRHLADVLDKGWISMLATYETRTGKRRAAIERQIDAGGGEWWMPAAEAVAAGFADESIAAEDEPRLFGLSRFKRLPESLAAAARAEGGDAPAVRGRSGDSLEGVDPDVLDLEILAEFGPPDPRWSA